MRPQLQAWRASFARLISASRVAVTLVLLRTMARHIREIRPKAVAIITHTPSCPPEMDTLLLLNAS